MVDAQHGAPMLLSFAVQSQQIKIASIADDGIFTIQLPQETLTTLSPYFHVWEQQDTVDQPVWAIH